MSATSLKEAMSLGDAIARQHGGWAYITPAGDRYRISTIRPQGGTYYVATGSSSDE